jgi:hypothetical protein
MATTSGITFHPFWSQTEITNGNANVACSYYKGSNKVLAHLANVGGSDFTGTISFNARALGLTGSVTARNAETGNAIAIISGGFTLSVKKHDYRLVQLDGGRGAK